MGNKNEELYETIPHLLYIYVRTLFCVNKYIVPFFFCVLHFPCVSLHFPILCHTFHSFILDTHFLPFQSVESVTKAICRIYLFGTQNVNPLSRLLHFSVTLLLHFFSLIKV